jgi:hypothetical protein
MTVEPRHGYEVTGNIDRSRDGRTGLAFCNEQPGRHPAAPPPLQYNAFPALERAARRAGGHGERTGGHGEIDLCGATTDGPCGVEGFGRGHAWQMHA